MSRLTLPQAREGVAALAGPTSLIDPAAIDWTQPDREAVTFAGLAQSTADFGERENIVAVCLALLAYSAHLSFEAGRAFELAAVQRARATSYTAERTAAGAEAIYRFGELLTSGLHHAEPASPVSVQSFDVWLSDDMMPTEVRCVLDTGNLVVSDLYGNRGHRVVSAADFTSNRRLVKRDGKAPLPRPTIAVTERPSDYHAAIAGRAVVTADVRADDVWKGKGASGQLVKVLRITRNPWECDKVEWQGVGRRTSGRCDLAPFPRRRTLHERGGVRVGDVRAIGAVSTVKVLHIREDGATVENATSNEWLLLSYLAALPLVSRKEP